MKQSNATNTHNHQTQTQSAQNPSSFAFCAQEKPPAHSYARFEQTLLFVFSRQTHASSVSGDIAATPAPPERKGFVCSLKRATTLLNTRKDRGHGVDAGFRGPCCIVQIPSTGDRSSDWTSRLAFVGSFFRPTLSIRVGPRKLEAQPSDEMIKANF